MAWKRGSKSLRAPHVNLLPRRYSGSAKMKVLVSKPLPVFNKGHSSDHEGWAQMMAPCIGRKFSSLILFFCFRR
jgi:hypothetical protein